MLVGRASSFFLFLRVFLEREGGREKSWRRKKKKLTPLDLVSKKTLSKNPRPGPWQVLRRRLRKDGSDGGTVCVWSSEERPSLKKVSLEILNDPRYQ